jgi:hypothetical protein
MHISTRRLQTLMLPPGSLLAACGLATPMPLDSYAHTVTDGTVALYWNCSRPQPALVRVEGWANNPYYPQPITHWSSPSTA